MVALQAILSSGSMHIDARYRPRRKNINASHVPCDYMHKERPLVSQMLMRRAYANETMIERAIREGDSAMVLMLLEYRPSIRRSLLNNVRYNEQGNWEEVTALLLACGLG
jgi:hypothetical protein